jgi:Fe-S-cluster containining protein
MSIPKINIKNLFPKISEVCKNCNNCCRTYGWLLEEEAKKFAKKGYPVIKLNNSLFCIDSFIRDKKRNLILDEIPRCRFYGKRECLINKDKPFDCKLFPIKVKFKKDNCFLGLSLGCKYIYNLNEKEKIKIHNRVKNFIGHMPKKDLDEYLNLMYKVNSISQAKKFWMKKLITFKKEGNSWKLISFHD